MTGETVPAEAVSGEKGTEVTARCPECDAGLPFDAAEVPPAIKCGGCGHAIRLKVSEALKRDTAVDVCPECEGEDFYSRKDFNPQMGLAFVITGAVISGIFYFFNMDIVAYSVLAVAVLVDLMVFRRLGEVTICYRCHSEFRGAYPKVAPPFDLHTADVLEPEWQRTLGKR
jgi:uncharacterized protein (DUF983 family)